MKTPLIDGGLLNHTLYYFKCYQTVIGERNQIENEETKERMNKTTPQKGISRS
jgi:hypothetical protein